MHGYYFFQGCAVSFGPPTTRSSVVLSMMLSSPLQAEDLFLENRPLPTHLKPPPAAVPGSITLIDNERIKASGARDISERLRRFGPLEWRQGSTGRLRRATRIPDLELARTLQQRLDDQPITWIDNNDNQRRAVYLNAGLEF